MSVRLESLDDQALSDLYPWPDHPWLRVNFVSSLDGAATVGGLSKPLSSPADKRVFRMLRMTCDALLVGAATFRAENYRPLTLDEPRRAWRQDQSLAEYPTLVVVSASLDLDPAHPALAQAPVRPLVLAISDRHNRALGSVAEVVRAEDLAHGLAQLRERGLAHLLCEGGPHLFGALSRADLVDELCLTLSPQLAGGGPVRIIEGEPHRPHPMKLSHVLAADDGTVLLRHERRDRPT